jgi:hypothetical protein
LGGKNKVLDKLDAYIDKKFAPKPEKSGNFSPILDKKETAFQAIKNQLKGCGEGDYLDGVDCVKCRTCAEGETILRECDGTTTKDVVKCEPEPKGGCSTFTDCGNDEVCNFSEGTQTSGTCTLCEDMPDVEGAPPPIAPWSCNIILESGSFESGCYGGEGSFCGDIS